LPSRPLVQQAPSQDTLSFHLAGARGPWSLRRSSDCLEVDAVEVLARGVGAGVVAAESGEEQAEAGPHHALAVGVRVEGFAGRALAEGEAAEPLGRQRGRAIGADSLGAAVAEL